MLIFFDIDGTLISEQSHIMPESAGKAIQQARANGHVCMVNTGRTLRLVGPDITGLTEFDGFALGCGTMITCHKRILLHKTFDEEMSVRIIDGLHRHCIDAVLEGAENNYSDSFDKIHSSEFRKFIGHFDGLNFGSYEDAMGHFDKFYAYAQNPAGMDDFREEFKKELDFVDRERGYFEIMPKGCSKASAIRFVANALGIPMSQTAAIGDSGNDAPMIECARYGIAMGNATEEIKKAAAFVTTDVERDGIWNALEWLGVLQGDMGP